MDDEPRLPHATLPQVGALDLEDLLEELRQRALASSRARERLGALLDAVIAITADLELSDVLHTIIRAACDLVDARYGALGVLAPDREHLIEFVTRGVTDEERDAIGEPPRGDGVLGHIIHHPDPLRLDDLTTHPSSAGFPGNHPPMHTFLGAPVRIRDEIFGNIYLTEKSGGESFTEEDEAILVALAAAAGVAIDNARLYERTRMQRRWIEANAEISRMLLTGATEVDALDHFASRLGVLSSARLAALALSADDGVPTTLVGLHEYGGNGLREEDLLAALSSDDAVQVLQDGRGILTREIGPVVGDQGLAGTLGALVPDARPTTAALLPISAGTQCLGALLLLWGGDSEPAVILREATLNSLTEQVGLAIVAARTQRDRERLGLLEERDRIARDMHDHVIQRLFATGLSLQSASRLTEDPTIKERLDAGVDELDEAIKDIRQAIFELQRTTGRTTLAENVKAVARAAGRGLARPAALSVTGDGDGVPPDLEADIVAVIREGLTNVARHAEASSAAVDVVLGEDVVVCIRDDGIGVPGDASRRGLANLSHRATARGGTFSVDRNEPRGTILTWTVPWRSY